MGIQDPLLGSFVLWFLCRVWGQFIEPWWEEEQRDTLCSSSLKDGLSSDLQWWVVPPRCSAILVRINVLGRAAWHCFIIIQHWLYIVLRSLRNKVWLYTSHEARFSNRRQHLLGILLSSGTRLLTIWGNLTGESYGLENGCMSCLEGL